MPKVRYLRIAFAQELHPRDLNRFRAAVIEKTERRASLFHNHKSNTGVIYRYPLIQYKVLKGRAGIICLDSGTDDIHHLLQQPRLDLRLGKHRREFIVDEVNLNYQEVALTSHPQYYRLTNWCALNQKYYHRFRSLEGDEAAQRELLTSILRGNILAFAKGINWWVDGRIEVEIIEILAVRQQPIYKNDKSVLTFDLKFRANVCLPTDIGLGKRVSVGFGMVRGF